MKSREHISEKYRPFNFSSTRSHVIELKVTSTGVVKIETKLPACIGTVKGIYISCAGSFITRVLGRINLSFNDNIFKSICLPVLDAATNDSTVPLVLNEKIYAGTRLLGFFRDEQDGYFPYTLKIYLHYTEK